MDHVGIFKTANHMNNGIHLADIGKELVAKAFSFGCALYQSGDINEFYDSRSHLF